MRGTITQVARLGRVEDRVDSVLKSHEKSYANWLEKWDKAQREKFLSKVGPEKPQSEDR